MNACCDWLRVGLFLLAITSAPAHAADEKPAADLLNNWQEWRAGTIPTNALSVLRLLTPGSDGTNLTVTWESVAGRSYFLERSPDLSSASAFTRIATNLPGQPNTTSYVDTNGVGATPRLYRVGVE